MVELKAKLEAKKAKGGKEWTSELQDELNDVVLFLVDIDDLIEEKSAEAKKEVAKVEPEVPSYTPVPGTEDMVHLSLIKGRRFNPHTGKEESVPFTQMFTFPEWQLFKKNYKGLGFTIKEVLHDPYNEAAAFVTKSE